MDTEYCEKLTNKIPSRASILKLSDDELVSLHADHEMEITKITGQISASSNHRWSTSAKQARRILILHKTWIEREQRGREASAKAAQKEKNKAFSKELAESAALAKAERLRLHKEQDIQEIAVFKQVCREVIGDEMYQHIWQLTNHRLGA